MKTVSLIFAAAGNLICCILAPVFWIAVGADQNVWAICTAAGAVLLADSFALTVISLSIKKKSSGETEA